MRAWEAPVFFGAALAAHLAAFFVTAESGQDAAPGGAGEAARVTVAAASPELAALVEDWETPPQPVEAAEPDPASTPRTAPKPPRLAAAPAPAATEAPRPPAPMPALPDAPLPAAPGPPRLPEEPAVEASPGPAPRPEPGPAPEPDPAPEVEPESDRDPEPETALAESGRPAPRPERLLRAPAPEQPAPAPEPEVQPSAARAEQRAAGPVGTVPQGGAGQAAVATASPGEQANLKQVWGAQIQERLQRALVYPRQAQTRGITGRAMVELTVGADGRVRGRRLVGSSGHAILDQAALSTVDRARNIPPAPQALAGSSFTFQLPVGFQGR